MAEEEDIYEDLNFKFSLTKYGLETKELTECLTTKMDNIIDAMDNLTEKQIANDKKKKMIKLVRTKYCIRQNSTDINKTDQRKKCANKHFVDKGILRDACESPHGVQKNTTGMQGVVKHSKEIHTMYKDFQEKLVNQLEEFFGPEAISVSCKDADPDFCNKIDEYTLKILNLKKEITLEKCEQLIAMADDCASVVMGRFDIDCVNPNNLANKREWNRWRQHLAVYVSFAALFIALMIKIEVSCTYTNGREINGYVTSSHLKSKEFISIHSHVYTV